jgi:hypothetical protein
MAKIISHVWSQARGKIAGIVYYAGPGNPILARQYCVPVDPQSTPQNIVRHCLSSAGSVWQTLDDTTRLAYKAWSEASSIHPTGRSAYIRNSVAFDYMDAIGLSGFGFQKEIVPNVVGIPDVVYEPAAFTGTNFPGFAIKVTNVSEVPLMVSVQRSIPMSAARYYWRGPWQPDFTVSSMIAGASVTFQVEFQGGLEGKMAGFAKFRVYAQYATPYQGSVLGASAQFRSVLQPTAP